MLVNFVKTLLGVNPNDEIDISRLVFLDLETTGLQANRCDILEICLADTNRPLLSTLIDAGQPIPAWITEINGIDRDMIVGMPPFSSIAHQIYDLLKDKIVVGHNVEFDLKFLFHNFQNLGIHPHSIKYICTCNAERKSRGQVGNKLEECLKRRGINSEQMHRAADDVLLLKQLFVLQMKEQIQFVIQEFTDTTYKKLISQEPQPLFTKKATKRTTHTLRMFDGWGTKTDDYTVSLFNRLIEDACQDRIFESEEMIKLSEIGIEKQTAIKQLKKGLSGLIQEYYTDGAISWDEFKDLEEIAKLFGINSSEFFPLIKEVVPGLRVVCFTNDLIIRGQAVDRYETLFPWAVRNGFLPSDSVTKKTDLVVNCGEETSVTGKITKANTYGIEVTHISDFMKGKTNLKTT